MDKKVLLGIGGVTAGLIGLGFGIYNFVQLKDMSTKIGIAVKDLKDMTHVEVSEAVINKVVNDKADKVVTEELRRSAEKAASEVLEQARKEISNRVSEAVRKASEMIETGVKEQYEKELAYINIDDLMKEVKGEARKKIMKRFDGELDSILGDYTANLQNLKKAYSVFADAVKG